MSMFSRYGKPKMIKCPRCGLKNPEGSFSCADCDLHFDRLALATNHDAKRKKLRGDREFIIKVTDLPSDVSYIKLVLYVILLGVFGGHCYYVGRYLRGAMFTTNMLAMILFVVFNPQLLTVWGGHFFEIVMPFCGLILLVWIFDVFKVITKKFKVPVAIDLKVDEV